MIHRWLLGGIDMTDTTNIPTKWLSEKAVAKMLSCSVSVLQKHRFKNRGLPYVKFGKSVRYNEADIFDFMESQKVIPAGNGGISPRS